MLKRLVIVLVIVLSLFGVSVIAQEDLQPQTVEVTANDGLILKGDFYTTPAVNGAPAPAVLLLHMYGSQRSSWKPLIPLLLERGYHVLAVDMRGHGETGGTRDWVAAQTDVQTWFDWLRADTTNIRPDAISVIGASVGSNLALVGCSLDEQCVTAIALSPGLDYYGVMPEPTLEGLKKRSALFITAQGDRDSVNGVRQMAASATGEIGVRIYTGSSHGTDFFSSPRLKERVKILIVDWLDEHTPQPENG